jgi:hypothetical protein
MPQDPNLPPGVSESMIPGNRPEDEAEERFWEELFKRSPDDFLPEEWWEDQGIQKLVLVVRDMAYNLGFAEGRQEEQMAQAHECEHKWRDYGNEIGVVCRDCGEDAPAEIADAIRKTT